MPDLTPQILYDGSSEPPPETVPLRAGPLTLLFEVGDLRTIRWGDHEVLRRVYVAVRDRNWLTLPPIHSNLTLEYDADSFRIAYDCEHRLEGMHFVWRGEITGAADGTVSFTMDGVAKSTFLKNRIGFCVLHPIHECTGARCSVIHSNGKREESGFPRLISPHQPFLDMTAITHEVASGVWAEVAFEGDIFETEDQRNWTDASFKTYCTPISHPYPVEIAEGTRVHQSVMLKIRATGGTQPAQTAQRGNASVHPIVEMTRAGEEKLPPSLGLGIASHSSSLSERQIARLRKLNVSHLRVDLRLSDETLMEELERATKDARSLGVPLEAALLISSEMDSELSRLKAAVQTLQPDICRLLIFPLGEKATTSRYLEAARHHLEELTPAAAFGGGSNADFVDLNRFKPPMDSMDFVSYAMNPQVHAFDNASLMETLEAQASTVESARAFIGDLPLFVSPVTLKRRFNPDATGLQSETPPGELPIQVDTRQMSLFGAAWTLGSLASLASAAIEGVTYFETTGWRGIMETEEGSPLPNRFHSVPGGIYPMYHVFADVGEFAGGTITALESSQPLAVAGMMLRKCGQQRLLLANLSPQAQRVRVSELKALDLMIRRLNASNAIYAMEKPEEFRETPGVSASIDQVLELAPYEYLCLDGQIESSAAEAGEA